MTEPAPPLEFPPGLCRVLPELKELSEYFRCRVCYNFCSAPVVSTPCAHNFCSVCVRRYLQYKAQCPECFAPVHETDLRPNRALKEVMLLLIQTILPRIQKVAGDGKITFGKKKDEEDGKSVTKTQKSVTKTQKSVTGNVSGPTSAPKVQALSRSAIISSPQPVATTLPCPVCAVDIPKNNINLHLDRCLNGKLRFFPFSLNRA